MNAWGNTPHVFFLLQHHITVFFNIKITLFFNITAQQPI